ncbi:fatty acid desaturase-domain-containing protein [Flagelloscypha sp. PMI_526]|nr:fatty acid desaturase-domain-containing protein [Flagelloscypha sp. PMI_526]
MAPIKQHEQKEVVIPNLSVKDLLGAIPAHCFQRSAFRSSLYILWDFIVIGACYKAALTVEDYCTSSLPPSLLSSFAIFSAWSLYGFIAGLFGMGLWVIAHECGHGAFSESKTLNNIVGWILHSGLGVPYHSWRITHSKHHAQNCHMDNDQVFVPWTRKDFKLPELSEDDDLLGASVSDKVQEELWEALGDTPLVAAAQSFVYLGFGFPMYLIWNTAGQRRYPSFSNHYNPSAVMFSPRQYGQIILSDIGIILWLGAIVWSIQTFGFLTTFKTYLAPYLWVNHWLVLITFLQHTDPLVPHYHKDGFSFPRGALSTLDRSLLGDLGRAMGWLGAHATHGISETHVLHHVCSKVPHYNAWEASDALRKLLDRHGIERQGRPGGWAEVYRVFRACKFVEDDGPVVFYKNARGLAAARPVYMEEDASDSGFESTL